MDGSVGLGQAGPTLDSFFEKALEEDQAISEGGRVADRWRWTSGSLGPFTDQTQLRAGRR